MDITTIEHTLIAMVCTALGHLLGDINAGAAFGIAIFISREITQAEYRAIEKFYSGRRALMPWYAPFMPKAWDWHSLIDMLAPIAGASIVLLAHYFWRF